MLTDALTTFDLNASLTSAVAATLLPSTNTIDLSQSRDIGPGDVPFSVIFTTLPTSGTGGATINVALQTSADNSTWTTIEESGAQVLTGFSTTNYWAFRGTVPATVQRYLRIGYTASATLTAGVVTAQIGGEWPRSKAYPRNYVA